ncbi:hypothetical protein GCM10009555_053170 [Acrocarpospora macrocephala]|uniref:Glycosyltransferase RgtA/B/C/D-like domain-containing protein n=1 Tax=Acrocarpospora macrocephala TaxID=150177 RepID=A0A5M3WWR3_9ACTN|nr:hypothetical protein [Acrocarpospora macrocephala]GES11013.1 hypothetical protein Amac_046100 [Acrocarpospora macrocephala]
MLTEVRFALPENARPSRHRLFIAVLVAAATLRVITMLGFPPAQLYWYDSFTYLDTAHNLRPSATFHPVGYPLFLRLLAPFHSVTVVAAIQHVLGLATGLIIYLSLRRHRLPAWAATLAAVPLLFDASFLRLEHAVLSDTLFIFLVVAALALMDRTPLAAGLLLALAGLTRTVAVPLILLVLVFLLVRRHWRPALTFALAATLPLLLYATWYQTHHGRFALSGADGVALWARTMTFADCRLIDPPPDEALLCPTEAVQDAASEYVWDPAAAINRLPGGRFTHNTLARNFAIRAIKAQPFDYLREVLKDTAITFAWTPIPHPARVTPAFGFARGTQTLPNQPLIDQTRRNYSDIRGIQSVDPYASFLIAYQYPAYLRGPMIAVILLAGAYAALRRPRLAVLPFATAMYLLLAPIAVLDFDHRYVLPMIPVACWAAALAFRPKDAPPESPEPPV